MSPVIRTLAILGFIPIFHVPGIAPVSPTATSFQVFHPTEKESCSSSSHTKGYRSYREPITVIPSNNEEVP